MRNKADLFNSDKSKQFELERIETIPTGYDRQPRNGVSKLIENLKI